MNVPYSLILEILSFIQNNNIYFINKKMYIIYKKKRKKACDKIGYWYKKKLKELREIELKSKDNIYKSHILRKMVSISKMRRNVKDIIIIIPELVSIRLHDEAMFSLIHKYKMNHSKLSDIIFFMSKYPNMTKELISEVFMYLYTIYNLVEDFNQVTNSFLLTFE